MRGSTKGVREIILNAKRNSQAECRKVADMRPLTLNFLRSCLQRFILFRYLLTEEDLSEDGLRELAQKSLDRGSSLPKKIADLDTASGGCIGADSVDTKIALLLFAIQRDFGITLPLEKAVYVSTVTELAEMIFPLLEEKRSR